jgi:hypothetical protein
MYSSVGLISPVYLMTTAFVFSQQTKQDSAPRLQLVMGTVFRNASQMQTVLETPSVVSVAVCLLV